MGFVPNLLATCAESPALLEGLLALEECLSRGTLSPAEREIVMLTVSLENGCSYCVAGHSSTARRLRASESVLEALRNASPIPDPKVAALVRFVRRVTRNRGHLPVAEIRTFLMSGFTRAQMLESLGLVALKTGHNYVHAVTGPPLDPVLEAHRCEGLRVPLV